jgi:TolA-binding protein
MFYFRQKGFLYSADDGAGSGGAGAGEGGDEGGKGGDGDGKSGDAPTFETFYGGLSTDQKALLDGHVSGLKSGLDSERNSNKELQKQIKDLQGKAEKGSDLEKQLGDISLKFETEQLRADFNEEAHKSGVKNLKLAWTVAREHEFIDSKGRVNWDAMKSEFPELFEGKKPGGGDAGGGGGNPDAAWDMNKQIRSAAGRS